VVGKARELSAGRLAARTATVLLTALAAAAGGAQAQAYVVEGSCRDGAANGAYELRMPDGRLRVLGAFAKGRRTGTFLFWAATGARIAVIPYENDAKVGTVALWYAPAAAHGEPGRKLESAYSAGVLHGLTRSWHANGKPRTENLYERGELVAARAWRESGMAVPEDEVRRQAARDRIADEKVYAGLERTIAENSPRCD